MMQVCATTEPAPDRLTDPDRLANEDHVFQFGELVGVLDGATVPDGFDTGCVHGPAWYVRQLAARLAVAAAARPAATLAGNLQAAILAVRSDHGGHCDLDHPGTPSSTVCLLRHGGDHVDYLVLCDSPLVLDLGGEFRVITDDRLEQSMTSLRETADALAGPAGTVDRATRFHRAVTLQRGQMNRTHGYWVAAADPDAAQHAVTGTLPLSGPARVRRAALLSDGVSDAVDQFGLFDWPGLLDALTDEGPGAVIRRIRTAERADGSRGRYKRYDDATAALCLFDTD
jgi:hypothetical protein